ncbi:MAG: DUF4866 family protein [Dorea longicatena]
MEKKTLFPREEKSEILFKKISEDKWVCEKLMETFCSYLFSNDGVDLPDSPSSTEFAQALFNSYRNYFVNNRRQGRGKSRLHFYCICPFLWTAHRFSPIEPNRVRLSKTLWNFNVFSHP